MYNGHDKQHIIITENQAPFLLTGYMQTWQDLDMLLQVQKMKATKS